MTRRRSLDELMDADGASVIGIAITAAFAVAGVAVSVMWQAPAWLLSTMLSVPLVGATVLLWRMTLRAARYCASTRQFDATAVRLRAERDQLRILDVELALDFALHCPRAMGNSGRLQQVILNLILNARDAIQARDSMDDAMSRGGTVHLRTRYEVASRKVLAIVEDDGAGIPDAILPRLFEPFVTTKPTSQGTGLGLSVSYQIVRQMGGTIAGENRAEGGARFTVALDAAHAGGAADTPGLAP